MKFTVERERLLKPLQQVSNPLSSRLSLPILSNLLLQVKHGMLFLIRTDLEIEIKACVALSSSYDIGEITVSARKFFDICRGLSERAEISVRLENEYMVVCSDRSRFSLSTLPSTDFPHLDDWCCEIEFTLTQAKMKRLIEATQFSMAYQDVRYYLNGMLFEINGRELRAIATDGHRLAIYSVPIDIVLPKNSVIVSRKGVTELMRILDNTNTPLLIQIGSNNIRVHTRNLVFTSKLVDGHFPDYRRVLPENPDNKLEADCNRLKQAFVRASILSNERFRGIHLRIRENQLKIISNNLQREESEEILDVIYKGDEIEICLNVSYLLDVLNVIKCKIVRILLINSTSSIQIEDAVLRNAMYVIMPMRL